MCICEVSHMIQISQKLGSVGSVQQKIKLPSPHPKSSGLYLETLLEGLFCNVIEMLVAKLIRSFLNICLCRIHDFVQKTYPQQQPESLSVPEQRYLCFSYVAIESSFQEVYIASQNIFRSKTKKRTNRQIDRQKKGPAYQQTDN